MTVMMVSGSLTVYAEKYLPYLGKTFGSALMEQPSICGLKCTMRLV